MRNDQTAGGTPDCPAILPSGKIAPTRKPVKASRRIGDLSNVARVALWLGGSQIFRRQSRSLTGWSSLLFSSDPAAIRLARAIRTLDSRRLPRVGRHGYTTSRRDLPGRLHLYDRARTRLSGAVRAWCRAWAGCRSVVHGRASR